MGGEVGHGVGILTFPEKIRMQLRTYGSAVTQHCIITNYIYSAKSLFDLWLFLLAWPHTPQAFLETSPPSRPSEKT